MGVTVIITTHYTEEARHAHMVGIMRYKTITITITTTITTTITITIQGRQTAGTGPACSLDGETPGTDLREGPFTSHL